MNGRFNGTALEWLGGNTVQNPTDTYCLAQYCMSPELGVNIQLFIKLLAALFLGVVAGYERFFHGHAAGMRTYGLVCMASAGLVAISGYPESWFGGDLAKTIPPDPSRIIQGIVTGIGFLGAGVIVHDQFSTHGLTSAASIWASSAIGILVGIGFYPAAIFLTALLATGMVWVKKIENSLPSNDEIAVTLQFNQDFTPNLDNVRQYLLEKNYGIAKRSLIIIRHSASTEWRFTVVSNNRKVKAPITSLAEHLSRIEGITGFQLAHARN